MLYPPNNTWVLSSLAPHGTYTYMTTYKLNYCIIVSLSYSSRVAPTLPMQGKRPIAQSKVVFVSLLVVDMLNTILQEIISKGDQVASARAAIVVFALCYSVH